MKRSSIFLLLLPCLFVHASSMNQAYQEGNEVAKTHAGEPTEILKSLDLTQIPGYQASVPEQNYYGGVTQSSTRLEADSQVKSVNNEASLAVNESFNHRPLYRVNPQSESMQKLNQIADNGEAIIHGQDTSTTTCSLKPKTCHYAWQEKTCIAEKGLGLMRCARHLRIDMSPYKTESYSLALRQEKSLKSYKIAVQFATPNTCQQGKNPCYTIYKDAAASPVIVLPPNCAMVKTSILDEKGFVVVTSTANCSAPALSLSVGKCSHGRCSAPYFHTVTMVIEIFEAKEHWDSSCESLQHKEQEGLCRLKSPLTCTKGLETRMIGEVPVTRACWKEEASYDCGEKDKGTCEPLIAAGCEQTNSICQSADKTHCTSYQQTYQCPINQCTDNELICGGDAFCLDGDCSNHDYSSSDEADFHKAMASLSAASEASKDFNSKANFIFKGEKLECSREMAGVKNCCREKGWGLDLNLAHCKDIEKKLGKARENKLVVPTGEYCAERKKFPGGSVCKDHHQTYCVFQSKLARIIQEQGRLGQLHIGFGEGKHSNCTGITPAQLELIKFESINFSEFYQDVKGRLKEPNYQQTASHMSTRLKDFYSQGDFNG